MARSDMFLKLTGSRSGAISGESNDKQYPDQIEVVDWSWGMDVPMAIGSQTPGRVQMREIRIVKQVDRASTALMAVMNNNEVLSSAVLTVRKSGGTSPLPYFVVKLEKARIVNYDVQSSVSSEGAPVLVEHFSMAFKKIDVQHSMQSPSGGGVGNSNFMAEARGD